MSDAARGGGGSVFEFQDREDDVRAVFEKNIPFALDVAKSAADPANPVSHLGNAPENFEVSTFADSYGDPQDVQVNAKRELGKVTMHFRVNGGAEQTAPTKEWNGGERYGGGYDLYYHRLRGTGEGHQAGRQGARVVRGAAARSRRPSPTAALETKNPVLILASEDYTGHSPDYADKTGPNYLSYYQQALQANGIGYDVYDIDARGRTAPDPLGRAQPLQGGRLVHGRQPADDRAGPASDGRRRVEALRRRVPLGPGLPQRGRQAAVHRQEARAGISAEQYVYNVQGGPPYCDSAAVPVGACIPLSNDFLQYYLGSCGNNTLRDPANGADEDEVAASAGRDRQHVDRRSPIRWRRPPRKLNGADSAGNQDYPYTLTPTSTVLPAGRVPAVQVRARSATTAINGPLVTDGRASTTSYSQYAQPRPTSG